MSDQAIPQLPTDRPHPPQNLLINHAQLVLAEKRTSLAQLRTGIAVVALPMAIVSFLIAMSRQYHLHSVITMLLPLLAFCSCLALLGVFLIVRSVKHLLNHERVLKNIKGQDEELKQLL